MIVQWTRFSLRLLFVIAMVIAAYASGRASLDRRVYVAEADAAAARARAADLEGRLRSAQIEQAAGLQRRAAKRWPTDRRSLVNSRWIINTRASDEYQEATHLDSLGIKLIGLANDGESFQVVSNLASTVTVSTCNEVPTDFVAIEGTDLDRLILVRAGLAHSMSGVARLLPVTLAEELLRVEAITTALAGFRAEEMEKIWFRVDNQRAGQLRVSVTAKRPLAGVSQTRPKGRGPLL